MNFKWIILVMILGAFSFGMNAQMMNNLTIFGNVQNTNSPYVYLSQLTSDGVTPLDTAELSAEGNFQIYSNIKNAGYFQIHLGTKQYAILVLHPNEHINITLNGENLMDIVSVSGSEGTEQVNEMLDYISVVSAKQDSLNKAYKVLIGTDKQETEGQALIDSFNALDKVKNKYLVDRITASPSLGSLLFLEKMSIEEYMELYKKLDASLYPKYKHIKFVSDLHNQVKSKLRLAIGQPAPEIELPDTNNQMVKLSDFKGKVVLIDFWASWCAPCRKESPNMVKYYEKYHDMGFEILSVSLDKQKSDWMRGIHEDKLFWTHISDLRLWKSVAAKTYGVSSIPFTVLVDEKGNIIATNLRGAELEQKLDEIFMQ